MGSFSLQEVHFSGFPLEILSWIINIVSIFSPCLEEFALPSGVAFVFTTERAIKRGVFLMTLLTVFFTFLELGTLFFLLVLLFSSEAADLATEMLSVVSARLQCSTKVTRYPVSILKPWEISMALWLLGALLAKESTSSDLSSCWFSSNRGGICAILEFRSQTNPTYCLVVILRGFSIL